MASKAKAPPVAAPAAAEEAQTGPWLTPAWTMEERLRRIEAMGQRIHGYIQFMSQVGSLSGTSDEAKERAVTAFYERMVVVDRQLGRIHDDLRLG